MKASRSRWALFMLAWILKTKAEKSGLKASITPLSADPGQGRRGQAQELLQEGLHAEVGQGGAEEHRGQLPVPHGLQVKFPAGRPAAPPRPCSCRCFARAQQAVQHLGSYRSTSSLSARSCPADQPEKNSSCCLLPVVDALELLAAADGPVHGVGLDAQLPLHLLQQVEGVLGLPVHLVDEGENGNVAHGADLEQLPGLGLHALGCRQ